MTEIKICGLTESESLRVAIDAGAHYLGFVFYPPSPRNISADDAADLVQNIPDNIKTVGLFVDPDDESLESVLGRIKINMLQLHGNETPRRAAEIKARFSLPIIKSIRIGSKKDIAAAKNYEGIVDCIMFDAKVADSSLPGGTGQRFDWTLLKDYDPDMPWFLAGGLTSENVAEALSILTPDVVDVSSGVETVPGQKDTKKIRDFIRAIRPPCVS